MTSCSSQSYPDDCLQALYSPWWEETEKKSKERGRLVYTYHRFVEKEPYEVHIEGRDGVKHENFIVSIKKFDNKKTPDLPLIPVAAVPVLSGERLTLNKGKVRPAIILATPGESLSAYQKTFSKHVYAPTYIIAPYFTCHAQASCYDDIVNRIKRCEFRQIFWDKLPKSNNRDSFLRFDQLQAVEPNTFSFEATNWKLTEDALQILDLLFLNFLYGTKNTAENALLAECIEDIAKIQQIIYPKTE